MSSDETTTPDVESDLGRHPLPRLFFYLYKRQFTGSLQIARPEGDQVRVWVRDGLPCHVEMRAMEDVLGRVLLERGFITQEQYNDSLVELAKGGKRHGRILLEMGAIDPGQLIAGLQLQLRRKLNRLFHYQNAPFALHSGEHGHGLEVEERTVRADPLWVIYQGVRNAFDEARLASELDKLRGNSLQLHPAFGGLLDRFGLDGEEKLFAQVLMQRPVTLDRALQISNLSARVETEMLIYTFWVTEGLVVSDPPAAAQQVDLSTPVAPASATARRARTKTSVAGERVGARIKEQLKSIDRKNHFEVLGVTRNAGASDVRDAYFKLAKEFHPDRVAGLGVDEEVRQQAEELFRRIGEAHSTLSDGRSRADYEKSLDGAGGADEAQLLVEAEMSFQRGTVYFRKRDFKRAIEQFEQAWKLNDKEGEHLAWLAWARYSDPRSDKKAILDPTLGSLRSAAKLSPKRAQTHYFLGEVLLAKGAEKQAVAAFEKVVEINDGHVDALRQLRLLRMRHERGGKHGAGGGRLRAISKYFKK